MLRYDDTELAIRRNTSPMLSLYRANGTQSASLDASGGTLSLLARENGAPIIIDNPGQSQAIRIDAEGSICINCTDSMGSLHAVSTTNAVGADIFRADGPAATRLFAVKTDTTVFMASGSTWTFGANGVVFSTATTGPLTSGIGGNIVLMDSGVGIGDPSPDARLDVTGVAGDTNVLDISSNNATSLFSVAQSGNINIISGSTLTIGGSLAISTAASAAATSDKAILISPNGNVAMNSATIGSAGTNLSSAWTSWTPTFGGFSADPTVTSVYAQIGKIVHVNVNCSANGTSNATSFTISLPVAAKSGASGVAVGLCRDNNALNICYVDTSAASATATLSYGVAYGGWTSSGNKCAFFSMTYEAN